MTIEFTKLHGLGNDYLFIDTAKYPIADPPELSRAMSHRHLGAGADGIILIESGKNGADFSMRIFNADGSEAETCGNGIRCFAKYVYERGMTTKTDFVIDTLAGPNRVVLTVDHEAKGKRAIELAKQTKGKLSYEDLVNLPPANSGGDISAELDEMSAMLSNMNFDIADDLHADAVSKQILEDKVQKRIERLNGGGIVSRVRSNMGKPKFDREEIPMIGAPGQVKEEAIDIGGTTMYVTCANIGNPHAVFFVDDATKVPLAEIGPKVEHHPAFPKRTNVEFVTVQDRENIVMRIWERGSGITMASGSGSCGSALACMITNRTGRRVNVHLVYGTLTIEWAEDGYVYQEGPATEVYTGTWE